MRLLPHAFLQNTMNYKDIIHILHNSFQITNKRLKKKKTDLHS